MIMAEKTLAEYMDKGWIHAKMFFEVMAATKVIGMCGLETSLCRTMEGRVLRLSAPPVG